MTLSKDAGSLLSLGVLENVIRNPTYDKRGPKRPTQRSEVIVNRKKLMSKPITVWVKHAKPT